MSQSNADPAITMPPEAYQLGAAPISIYRGTRSRLTTTVIFVVLVLFFGGLGVLGVINGEILGLVIFGAISLFFLWLAVGIIREMIRDRGLVIAVMPEGLFVSRAAGNTPFRWADISGVWQRITRRRTAMTYSYTIQRRDGARIVFSDQVADIAQLGETIQENVTRTLLPATVEAFQAGATIGFDALALSKQGVTMGQKSLPWEQVREVKLSNGQVMIWPAGGPGTWAQVPAARVANLYVFLNLVHQIVGIAA